MTKKVGFIVKDNALIDASFNLSLAEQRLMLLAILEAREKEQGLTTHTPIEVKCTAYQKTFVVDASNAYKQLTEASKQLFNRQFSYVDRYKNDKAITLSRWVRRITYVQNKGLVVLYLDDTVIEMISRLKDHFTKYLLEQVALLKSQYSIRFYELLLRNSYLGRKQYSVTELRNLLGIEESSYKSVSYLKRDVIDKALKEVNKKTDITATYTDVKEGRIITDFVFSIKKEKDITPSKAVKKTVKGMTEKQALLFADRLSANDKFTNHFIADVGETIETYKAKIANKLADPFYVKEWQSYLIDVGYKDQSLTSV